MRGDSLGLRRSRKIVFGALAGIGIFALTAAAALASTVTNISVNGDCFSSTTTGTVTVTDVGAGFQGSLTLEIFAHEKANGVWYPTGATTTVTVKNSGTQSATEYVNYSISGLDQTYTESPYNSLRVQIVGSSPSNAFGSSVNQKSTSFSACTPFIVAESPLAIGLPIAGLAIFGFAGAAMVMRRRRGMAGA